VDRGEGCVSEGFKTSPMLELFNFECRLFPEVSLFFKL